ncbi:hypothetical protein JCM5353_006118 [Sporobolomyces roseus]
MNLTDTSWLPSYRFTLLSLLAIASIATFLMSIATLAYQLQFTVGYNQPVPSLLVCSALTLFHASIFLSPITPASSSRRGSFLALRVELVALLVLGLFTLATVARLHSSTPGLYSNCGGYFICVSLQADVALAWFSFLFLVMLFVPLLLATVYHYRRSHSTKILREPFVLFNWRVYSLGGGGGGSVILGEGGMTIGKAGGRDNHSEEADSRFTIS